MEPFRIKPLREIKCIDPLDKLEFMFYIVNIRSNIERMFKERVSEMKKWAFNGLWVQPRLGATRFVVFPILLLMAALLGGRAFGQAAITPGETLTLDRCIEIALQIHPSIVASANTVKASQARVGEAAYFFYPQVSAAGAYSRVSPVQPNSTTSTITTNTKTTVHSPPLPPVTTTTNSVTNMTSTPEVNPYDQYNANITLTQNLFDFGRTYNQTKVQSYNLDSSKSDLETANQQVIFNVKQAYYNVLLTKRQREVAEQTVKQFEQHLTQARGFYEVGAKPKYDVTKAEVDRANSKLSMIQAENAFRVAKITLNNAMGLPEAPDFEVVDNLEFQKYEITFEQAKDRAYQNRPDLKSSLAREKAAKSSVNLAWTGYAPYFTGNAAYQWSGQTLDEPLKDSWNVGVNLNVPLFNGFLTKYQVDESKANLNIAGANEELLRQGIMLEVQQAYLSLMAAEDSVPAAELAQMSAQENLDLANGRYTAGVGSPIEVTDAEVAFANAQANYIQALYNYKIAQATLLKAMGER